MFEYLPKEITEEFMQYMIVAGIFRIIIWLFFGYTIYRTLKLVKKENQCILPSQAWFVALPFFNIYWNFEVVRRLSDSLNNEFYDRQIEAEENPTRRSGMLFAWTFLLSNIPLPPFILVTIGLLHLVYFVTYWVKIVQHRSLLQLHIGHYGVDYKTEDKNKHED